MAATVDELLDGLPERFDVMDLLGAPLPIRVLGDMMGIPREDHEVFTRWSTEIAHILELGAEPSEDVAIACQKAVTECTDYFTDLLEKRGDQGEDDLLSQLARARDFGEGLTIRHIAAVCVLLVVPGLDTFANLVGNAAVLFARHPEVLPGLAAEPETADAVLDEILRLEPPTHASWRVAIEPLELHGHEIKKGDVVLLLLAAANRDERVFPDPEIFNPGAHSRKHLSFGRGIHYCVGDMLSRLMAKEAFNGLARRVTSLKLEDEEVAYKPGIWLRGPARLPVLAERRAR
ncbi:cytochrome P450 [Streptomyces stramineus]